MKNISMIIVEKFSNLEDSFDPDESTLNSFRRALESAMSDTGYSRQDLLFDIRSGMNVYRDTRNHDSTDSSGSYEKFIERIGKKAQICAELGLAKDICAILLTEHCEMNCHGYLAREIAREFGSRLFDRLVCQLYDLANDVYANIVTQSFVMGFIKDMDLDIIRKSRAAESARQKWNQHLVNFAKLTGRRDVLSVLSTKDKRHIISDDLSL